MPELITLGETMAVMAPKERGPLRYCSDFRLCMAGSESNTAIGLSKLGHSAGWLSRLGTDELGDYILAAVRGEGVDVSHVVFDQLHRTGLMVKRLSPGETSVYYYRENSAASHFCAADIPHQYLHTAKILHLTGITPILSEDCEKAAEAIADFAAQNQKLLSFDPNIRRKLWGGRDHSPLIKRLMFASQIVLTGLDEAAALLGTAVPAEIAAALRGHGVRYIALKDGARGAWCADETELVQIPPVPCDPVDPIGAGDGFNAGFLSGILEGRDLETCGRMGAIAGAMATETHGDIEGYPTRRQMEERLAERTPVYR